jgi:hypothetical protein
MIVGELTWQQFKTLDSIRNLDENRQLQHYYEYLVELNEWAIHQNKAPLTSTTATGQTLLAGSVLFNSSQGSVYYYDVASNTSTMLNVPSTSSLYAYDIAHTQNKLWLNGTNKISEWNITLNPFTATFSRIIDTPHNMGVGLGAINDTTLIATNISTTPNTVVTLDVTNNSATSTYKFDLTTGRTVAGDILLTTTNKVIVTNNGAGAARYVTQYDYLTGTLEVDTRIDDVTPSPYGLYIDDSKIFIMNFNGDVYLIDKTSPYGKTLVGNTGVAVNGASQVPSALTVNFT